MEKEQPDGNWIRPRPFVVPFDFDTIDQSLFHDVLFPPTEGISVAAAEYLIDAFRDAYSFEFVEYAHSGDRESAEIAKNLIRMVMDN